MRGYREPEEAAKRIANEETNTEGLAVESRSPAPKGASVARGSKLITSPCLRPMQSCRCRISNLVRTSIHPLSC